MILIYLFTGDNNFESFNKLLFDGLPHCEFLFFPFKFINILWKHIEVIKYSVSPQTFPHYF